MYMYTKRVSLRPEEFAAGPEDSLVGKTVITTTGKTFVVCRVIETMFGPLAVQADDGHSAWSLDKLTVIAPTKKPDDFETQITCEEFYGEEVI